VVQRPGRSPGLSGVGDRENTLTALAAAALIGCRPFLAGWR
jgi:hypothetical protein